MNKVPLHDKCPACGMAESVSGTQNPLEHALIESRNQLRSIIDNTPALVYVLDLEGRFLTVNAASAELLNSTPQEVVGKKRPHFMPQDVAENHAANDRKVIETGYTLEFEEQGVFDGKQTTFLTTKFPLFEKSQKICAVAGISIDITARKQAEEELWRLNAELQNVNKSLFDSRLAALNLMDDAIAARTLSEQTTQSLHLEITARQKKEDELHTLTRALTALGHSSKCMMRAKTEKEYLADICKILVEDCGYALVSIGYAENDENKTVRPVANAGFEDGYLDRARVSWADTERGRGPSGTAIRTGTISFCNNMQTDPRFAPWRDEAIKRGYRSSIAIPLMTEGKAFGVLGLYSEKDNPFIESEVRMLSELADDLSYGIMAIRLREELAHREEQLKERADQLTQANKELESFSYSVSHDLRAPIRAIRGFCDILLDEYAPTLDAQAQNFLGRIIRGTDKMSGLIDDMLGLAKISLQAIKPRPINLAAMALSTVNELRQTELQRKVTVVIESGLQAFGDQRLLSIALSNLIGNAWKYTSKKTDAKIEVGVRETSGEKVYFVRDNGAGFDMNHAKKLFVPFQRLHSESQFPGTGIGLAIVSKIIQRHGGRVWGESTTGNGATFYFTLWINQQTFRTASRDSYQ